MASLWVFVQAYAQQGPQDAFTFFIPFPAMELDDLFNAGFDGSSWSDGDNYSPLIDDDIVNVISIAVDRSGTIIYYDQWEDGLEDHLTSPQQSSTQIWGDNNPTNGIPPGFATDVLNANDVIELKNQMTPALMGHIAAGYYDGGDVLTAVDGGIVVTYAAWPY